MKKEYFEQLMKVYDRSDKNERRILYEKSLLNEVSLDSVSAQASENAKDALLQDGPINLLIVQPSTGFIKIATTIVAVFGTALNNKVQPVFVLYNPTSKELVYDDFNSKIHQPLASGVKLLSKFAIMFEAPEQREEVIKKIVERNLQLHLAVFRLEDGRMSERSFQFYYQF